MTGAPLCVSCASVMPLSTSALCVTSVPASDTGEEPPAIAIESTLTGMPARAPSMMISQASLTSLSGLTGQVRKERMGRRRSCSRPPTIAAAMSIILRAQKPESGPMVACLVVLLKIASALCSAAVSGGASWAPSGRSSTSISGSASMIFVQSATSCLQALVQLAGVRVDDLDALAEVGEADPAVLEHDVPGRVAAAHARRWRAPSGPRPPRGAPAGAPRSSRGRSRRRPPRRSHGPRRLRRRRPCATALRASRRGSRAARRR